MNVTHSNPHHLRSTRRAFTLIEVLVVISIIVLLIAILLPVLGKARESARMSICASNVRQQVLGLLYYTHDYKAWLPTYDETWAWGAGGEFFYPAGPTPGIPIWQYGLSYRRGHQAMRIWGAGKYIQDHRINICPSFARRLPLAETMWANTTPSVCNFPAMTRGEGQGDLYQPAYWPLSYIGNTLGPLDVSQSQRRINAFNIGDEGYVPNVPKFDYLVRDGGNYYAWTDFPFNHAGSDGATWATTMSSVTGWNTGYPDGHVQFITSQP